MKPGILSAALLHGDGEGIPVHQPQSCEEIQREYDLTPDDIRAALKFLSELAEQESFHSLPAA